MTIIFEHFSDLLLRLSDVVSMWSFGGRSAQSPFQPAHPCHLHQPEERGALCHLTVCSPLFSPTWNKQYLDSLSLYFLKLDNKYKIQYLLLGKAGLWHFLRSWGFLFRDGAWWMRESQEIVKSLKRVLRESQEIVKVKRYQPVPSSRASRGRRQWVPTLCFGLVQLLLHRNWSSQFWWGWWSSQLWGSILWSRWWSKMSTFPIVVSMLLVAINLD